MKHLLTIVTHQPPKSRQSMRLPQILENSSLKSEHPCTLCLWYLVHLRGSTYIKGHELLISRTSL